ncbi:unnamed protein product, partial [Meganyctiphanes norvegica]
SKKMSYLGNVILCLHLTGIWAITCYYCSNNPEWDWLPYDASCGFPDYGGNTLTCEDCVTCRTDVYNEGSLYRNASSIGSDGECANYDNALQCFCKQELCNSHLCEGCSEDDIPRI